MKQTPVTHATVRGEALFILKSLQDNGRLGRSNKLADVKSVLEPSVSLEFDNYFFFLRKFHYIAMDREAQLRLTEAGERVLEGEADERFGVEVGDFFGEQLLPGETTHGGALEVAEVPFEEPVEDTGPISVAGEFTESFQSPFVPETGAPPPLPLSAAEVRMPPPPPPAAPLPLVAPAIPPTAPAPAAAAGPKGTDVDNRYLKFEPVGSGPLGTVFKGRQHALGLEVALKELKDIFGYFSFLQRGEVLKRLKQQLCAQAQVRHPAVLAVLDQNTEVARPYYVTELMAGSLRERLAAAGEKGLEVQTAVRLFLQMAYGLRAAHAADLTHHNLKPENVLLDAAGNVRLSDFGLGRVIEVDASKGLPQVFMGTGGMAYMAPELLARSRDAGPSADVYGLGILLYEMLTGQIPGRRSPLPSEVNRNVPAALDPIFDKMTQDKREARYASVDAMLEDFYAAFAAGEYLGRGDLVLAAG